MIQLEDQLRDLLGERVHVTEKSHVGHAEAYGTLIAVGYGQLTPDQPQLAEPAGELAVAVRCDDGVTVSFPALLARVEPAPSTEVEPEPVRISAHDPRFVEVIVEAIDMAVRTGRLSPILRRWVDREVAAGRLRR